MIIEENIASAAESVAFVEDYLRELPDVIPPWESTYIHKQILKRKNGEAFSISDHIRAMVYAMLSANARWGRIEKDSCLKMGNIPAIDEIFCGYEPKELQNADSQKIYNAVRNLSFANISTKRQIEAMIEANIPMLMSLERRFGSIDEFYRLFTDIDETMKMLLVVLSDAGSPYKLEQMGDALTAEYLRNIGYDISGADKNIRRILGCEGLGCSDWRTVPVYEVLDIATKLAARLNKSPAEVDYILRAYCTETAICTSKSPKCTECVCKDNCKRIVVDKSVQMRYNIN